MTIPLDEELRSLQTRISAVQSRRMRAEVARDNAKAALVQSRELLKEEFGVSTGEDAKSILQQLTSELEGAVEVVRSELEAAGA